MAILYLRNGNYYLNYVINGKRVRRSVGKDRNQAEIFLKEFEFKISKGIIKPENPEILIDTFFDKYLVNCKQRLSEGTYIRYRNSIKHFRRFFIYHHPLKYIHQIGRGAFQEYVTYRQESKTKPKSMTINVELRSALVVKILELD